MTQTTQALPGASPPTLRQLLLAFSKIGLSSFGGGISAWMLQEFVRRRRWLSEDAFFNGLAISQALPGVNVVNLSIWVGYQLRGLPGALTASLGFILPDRKSTRLNSSHT